MKKEIKILLANDHTILRNGIINAFKKLAPHIQIVAEAANFQEILALLPQIQTDILITDDAMPDRNLLATQPLIKEQYPRFKNYY